MITVFHAFQQFIKRKKDDAMTSKCTNFCMIMFLIMTLLSIGLWNLYCVGGDCYGMRNGYIIIELSTGVTYTLQGMYTNLWLFHVFDKHGEYTAFLGLIIFFEKSSCVFKKSAKFRLTKWTENGFRITLLLQLFCGVGIFFLHGIGKLSANLLYLGSVIGMLDYFLLTILLVALFIHKLIQIYRDLNKRGYNEETEFLIEPITKVTILCSISLLMTLINVTVIMLWIVNQNTIIGKFGNYTAMMDIYTNFICALFCNKMFKEKYLMTCSCLDKKCRRCWKKIVNGPNPPISGNPPKRQVSLKVDLESNSIITSKD